MIMSINFCKKNFLDIIENELVAGEQQLIAAKMEKSSLALINLCLLYKKQHKFKGIIFNFDFCLIHLFPQNHSTKLLLPSLTTSTTSMRVTFVTICQVMPSARHTKRLICVT